MSPSAAISILASLIFASRVAAHGFDWVRTLPDCWQECLANTGDGCDSKKCICDSSQSDSYLTSAVSCAVSECEADDWVIDSALLLPLQAYCGAVGNAVPESIISSAYVAATATSEAPPLTTRKVEHSQKSSDHEHTTQEGDDLKSTITTTITQRTTDTDGNTLYIIVPIAMGPNTMSTGNIITSTLEGKVTATDSPSSAAAPSSPTAAVPAPASTQGQQLGSSTTSSQQAQRTSNSNGSPFENMQAGADRLNLLGALAGVGVVVGLFMRL